MCKMTPIDVRLNLKTFMLINCGVTKLLRKVSGGGTRFPLDHNAIVESYDLSVF